MSWSWELPAHYAVPDDEHPDAPVWEGRSRLDGFEESIQSLYDKDGYHVHTGVPLEEGYVFPFDERVAWTGRYLADGQPEYQLARKPQ